MGTPIFSREDTSLKGVFSSDSAQLTFKSGVTGALIQGLNFNYAQQVTRLYEIGNEGDRSNIYYVGGRTQGTVSLNRVIGPNAVIKTMYSNYGDVCQARENTMTLKLNESDCSGQGAAEAITYEMKFCVITQVGVQMQAEQMIINEQTQMMFSGLDVS